MRRIAALVLFVYLSGFEGFASGAGGDWFDARAQAMAAADRADYQAALNHLARCRDLARTPAQTAVSANDTGQVLTDAGQLKEARQWFLRSVADWKIAQEHFGRMAETEVGLARVDRQLGEYAEAEGTLREIVGEARKSDHLSPHEIETKVRALDELGDMMREQGRNEESRQLLEEAAREPGVSWRMHVDSDIGLAELDNDARNWDESIARWNSIADAARTHDDATLAAIASRGLAQTWLDRGNPSRAEPLFRSALAKFEMNPDLNGRQVAMTLTCIGGLYLSENKVAMAEETLTKALEEDEHTFGASHPQVAMVHQILADTLSRRNDMDLAREHLERAVHILTGAFGAASPVVGADMAIWGMIEQRAHNPERAAGMYEKSLASLQSANSPQAEHVKVLVLAHYADVLKATHHKDQANAVLAQLKSYQAK